MDYATLTASRLKFAMEAVGLNQTSLADAWREYNDIHNLSNAQGLPVTRKTIGEWMERGIPVQSPKLGLRDPLLHVAEFFRVSKEDFLKENDGWNSVSFQASIRAAWQQKEEKRSLREPNQQGILSVLSELTEIIDIKNLERVFRDYAGYYYGYHYWIQWTEGKEISEPTSVIYKFLLKIDKIDYQRNLIKTKWTTCSSVHATPENGGDFWEYQGVMVPISNSLYFMAESKYRILEDSCFVFVITHRKPKNRLIGLLTSETTSPHQEYFRASLSSFPASARVLFSKIEPTEVEQGENQLLEKLGFFHAEELHELEPEILQELRNEIRHNVLTTW